MTRRADSTAVHDGIHPQSEALDLRAPRTTALAAPADMPEQVMALYQQALAQGAAGVGALEKLIDLQERIQRRSAELEFSRALAEFQTACPAIEKSSSAKIATKSGGSYQFTYADLEEIISTVRPHLAAHGFSFTFDSEANGQLLKCVVTLRHAHGHSMTSSCAVPTTSASGASDQQKIGAAMTYAKRQCLISVLGLSLTDPEEAGNAPGKVARVSDDQAATLASLIEEAGVQPSRFCERFKIEAVADLPASLYAEAVRLLEAKRKAVTP